MTYKGLRVCVSGGAGFLGSHLVDLLVEQEAEVYVLDDFSRGRNTNDKATYIKGDAGDKATCEWAFRGGIEGIGRPVDVVFNLAATVAGVEHNMAHGYDMFLDNVRLQVTPVAVAEKLGITRFLQVSSACVYDPANNHPALENFGLEGEPHQFNYGYGWAKRMGERILMRSRISRSIIVRPSNLYGPRDYFDDKAHVIPSLIRQYHEGKARMIGDGSAVREFFYVKDAAHAIAHLMGYEINEPELEIYNIGSGGMTRASIAELHQKVASLLGVDCEVVTQAEAQDSEMARWSDTARLQATGWGFATSLDKGLANTVEWYLEQQR